MAAARYSEIRNKAYRMASADLTVALNQDVTITDWSGRAERALLDQWRGRHVDVSHWDWIEVMRTHRTPDRIAMCIWGPDNFLSGLALGLTGPKHVALSFVEGCPNDGCRLRGSRALIAVDVLARYAQATGRGELRVEPMNSTLAAFYVDTFGFERVEVRKQGAYYRLEV